MQIGQFAARSGTIVETIRYYERVGLLPAPDRNPSGYRQYGEDHLRRLKFVRHYRDLGFSVAEIRSLLTLADDPERSCTEVTSLARTHLIDVRRKLASLRRLERTLDRLVGCCHEHRVADCRILEELTRVDQQAVHP